MSAPFLSVIIPAYNEEQRITDTLTAVVSYLKNRPWPSEIVVVSDGSTDRTVETVNRFQTIFPALKVISYPHNQGKGYAVKCGILAATGQLRLFMDADSSTPIEEFQKLLFFMPKEPADVADHYEVVVGSLGIDGAEINKKEFFLRVLGGKIGNFIIQHLVLPGIKDTQRGFKLFSARAASAIFSELSIKRWGFDVEVLVLARLFKFAVKEVPVRWSYRPGGTINFFSYLQVLGDVFRIRRRLTRRLAHASASFTHAEYCQKFLPPAGAVLDVGSGRGDFLTTMAKAGFRAVGIESSRWYVEASRALARREGVGVEVHEGKAEATPFDDTSFDFVNCAEVTEHVDNPQLVCREIYRVLKPGGKGYISFHNRFGIYDYHYHLWCINWLPRRWTEPVLMWLDKQKPDGATGRQKLITMHYYTYRQAERLLKRVGFSVIDGRAEKIKIRYPHAQIILLPLYRALLRPLYFNTFHMLVGK